MLLAIIFIVLGLSLLVLIHEAGHFFAAKAFGMKVEEFGFGFPPRAWAKQIGETVYSLNWLPIGGFVRLMGEIETTGAPRELSSEELPRSFRHQKPRKRAAVIAAGVVMNFVLGWLLISTLFFTGIPKAIVVTEVQLASPAEAAGILADDRILGYASVDQFIGAVEAAAGQQFTFQIARENATASYALVPRTDPKPEEGRIGVQIVETGTEPMGLVAAIGQGFLQSLTITKLIFLAIVSLLGGILMGVPDLSAVTGPVGIFTVASDASSLGVLYLVQLLALISLNLAVLNILPFPALDGGGLMFLIIEKLRGMPLSLRTERLVTSMGFATLLLLMAAITVKDILML